LGERAELPAALQLTSVPHRLRVRETHAVGIEAR